MYYIFTDKAGADFSYYLQYFLIKYIMYVLAFDCTEKVNVVFYNKKHEQNKKEKGKEFFQVLYNIFCSFQRNASFSISTK